jgi:hypothetical protein
MAFFPSAVATAAQLLVAKNNTKVLLAVAAGVGDTTLTVDDASPLNNTGYLTFDDDADNPETISYTGISGNDLTGVTRGDDNTSAGTHVIGVGLELRWNAKYHNILADEIRAAVGNIRDRFGLNTNIVIPTGISVQDADGIGIGAALVAGCILSLTSTTKAFRPPVMTTTQRDAISSPSFGMMIANSTTSKYNVYDGAAWVDLVQLTSGGDIQLTTAAKGIIVKDASDGNNYRIATVNGELTTEAV